MGTLTSLMVKIGGDLRDLEQTLDEAPSRLDRAGQRLSMAAAGIGAGVGAALGAGIVESLDVEAAVDTMNAGIGATGPFAQEMGTIAGDLYAGGFGESMSDVTGALESVWRSSAVMEDATAADIESVTGTAMELASVMGEDVTAVINAVDQMIKTGLAPDAQTAFDIITRGQQQGLNKSEDLLDVLEEYSTQFRKVGLDGQTAMGLISQGLSAGARDADLVSDAIKEFSIRAIDGSELTTGSFEALGVSAQDMQARIAAGGPSASAALDEVLDRLRGVQDPAERSAIAVGLFGTQAEDLGDALYALDPSSAVGALGQVEGAADQLSQTVADNPARALETFKRTAMQRLTEIGGQFATFAMNNQNVIQPMLIGLGALAAVILLVRGGMMAWTAVTTVWTGVQKAATIAQRLWNVAANANPMVRWVSLIVLVIGLIVGLYTQSETARNIINGAFSAIHGVIKFVWDWVSQTWPLLLAILTGPIGQAVRLIVAHWDEIRAGGEKVWTWIRDLPGKVGGALAGLAEILTAPWRAGFNAIARAWNSTVGKISFTLPGWVPGLGGKGFSMPRVPLLETGGMIRTAGLAFLHARETVMPAGVAPLPRGAAAGGGGAAVLELRSSGSRVDDMLLEILREAISARGGDVQTVLGR